MIANDEKIDRKRVQLALFFSRSRSAEEFLEPSLSLLFNALARVRNAVDAWSRRSEWRT